MRERLLKLLRSKGYKFHLLAKSERNEIYRRGSHQVNLPRVDVLSEVYVRSTLRQIQASPEECREVLGESLTEE